MAETFQQAFCREFSCSPEEYESRVFWKCVYMHARLPARLLWKKRAEFFREDFDLIREIASVNCAEVFRMEVNRFHGRNARDNNWLRRSFAIRLSGKKLFRLKNRLNPFE